MVELFHTILTQPLFNLLIWFYNVIPGADLGFAIIALTVLIKLLLWPLTHKSITSQKALQELQPKLEELKEKHKDDKEALAQEMMKLYSEKKVNPLSSCLPLLIQLPILIGLFRVLFGGFAPERLNQLYSFVANPGEINTVFLGLLDLSETSILMAALAGALQFVQTRMLMARRPPKSVRKKEGARDEDMMASMNKSMMYFMPAITVVIGSTLPGGLTLYWVALNALTILQQKMAFGKKGDAPTGDGSDGGPIDVEAKEKPAE